MKTILLVAHSPDALAQELIQRITAIARASVKARGIFTMAVSGGSMPKILSTLAEADGMDWGKCKIWFADERCVPLHDSNSNYKAWKALFASSGIPEDNIMAVDTELTPEQAAEDYEVKLKAAFRSSGDSHADLVLPCFDLLLLGIGPDGHTCSLFPNHALLEERKRIVAHIEDSPKPPPKRVTLTFPVLNNSRTVMFIGTGDGKAALFPRLLAVSNGVLKSAGASSAFPAARVELSDERELLWCVDKAAASNCSPEIMSLATKC